MTREPYGLRVHGCNTAPPDLFVRSGASFDMTLGGASCGQVLLSDYPDYDVNGRRVDPAAAQKMVVDPAAAQAAEACLARAFTTCQTSTFAVSLRPGLQPDPSMRFPFLLFVEPYHGHCDLTRLEERTGSAYSHSWFLWIQACDSATVNPQGLAIVCATTHGSYLVPAGQP